MWRLGKVGHRWPEREYRYALFNDSRGTGIATIVSSYADRIEERYQFPCRLLKPAMAAMAALGTRSFTTSPGAQTAALGAAARAMRAFANVVNELPVATSLLSPSALLRRSRRGKFRIEALFRRASGSQGDSRVNVE